MIGKNRLPELELYRIRRWKRWNRLNQAHRKATFEVMMERKNNVR